MSASVQHTTEAVFPVKEPLEISGAVVLFEGLSGSVGFPELIGREQSASVANWNVSSGRQLRAAVLYFWSQRLLQHLSTTMRLAPNKAPNSWCFVNAWDSSAFSCVPDLLPAPGRGGGVPDGLCWLWSREK